MTRPRYSIIPGGAVLDPHLEGRDLHVLCFLGIHTDKLGWCFLSQGTIASELICSRSTVQRSLSRLSEAGWIQVKAASVSGRPHACHAYRVIMDRDDPEIGPSELEVEDQERDGGCPPAGTLGAQPERAGVPAQDGHGVPTHTWAHNDQDSPLDDEVARARAAFSMSEEAHTIAFDLAKIAGHDPSILPTRWVSDGPAMRVQMGLDRGWTRPMMIENARAMMASKRDGPPFSIRYFEPGFAAAHARQSAPPQLPTAHPAQPESENAERPAPDWKSSRDNWRRTVAEFGAAVDDLDGSANPRSQGRA